MSQIISRLLSPRGINLLGFLACVVAMAAALYLQHAEDLAPCPLCVFQRIGVIGAGIFFLLAALHNPGATGQRVYNVLAALSAIGGAIVAGRHIWLQNLPADEVPACGPGLDYMIDVFPMQEMLRMVFSGSGECAEIDWTFLGITIPQLALITFAGLLVLALFQIFRRYR
ncbi:Periplasmic thiol:disulfide oxidoreductase DsbB [Alcanivorax sp. S71-1-4]|uniref:disulfide bond formation protein B n=1 Tax=Alcanivorax sp. S71-1-4 TaxID=1177159 RepID=UPI001359218E|nr:disulfide bond formation protein B [Alcanivorax sp. S71-1-4]KAF0807852.1 Periplasmic thiol:disulfide oxidoreductase DsbB [Alcanivorax sp. S71-1-4]